MTDELEVYLTSPSTSPMTWIAINSGMANSASKSIWPS